MRKGILVAALSLFVCSGCTSPGAKDSAKPSPKRHRSVHRAPIGGPPAWHRSNPMPAPRRGVAPVGAWYPAGGKISHRWKTIVIHHSATNDGGAATFDKFHRDKGWDELGYHFVIGNGSDTPDGFIEVGSRWHKQKHGAHCKTPDNYFNDHGIGICLVGDFTRTRPTVRQMESLTRLTRFLTGACKIPQNQVTTHGAVTHKTACPGKHFPLGALQRALMGPVAANRHF